jgi:hypothetical protein
MICFPSVSFVFPSFITEGKVACNGEDIDGDDADPS